MNYESIWKSLREVLGAHKGLADKFEKSTKLPTMRTMMKARINYLETLEKLMDDLENNMIGLELNDMEKEYKGDKCK